MKTSELEDHALTERERKNVSILESIKRYGPISRTDISKLTKLNIVTVSNYVNNFIEQGIVIEKGLDISSGGRRPTIVVLNPKAAYVVGVDLGVFDVATVMADLEGNIVAHSKAKRPRDAADSVVKVLTEEIEKTIQSSGIDPKKIRGIQIGASGVIDREVGTIRCTEGVASIYIPITALLQDKFKIPVKLEHDVTTAAYGEWSLGAGTDVDIMLFMYSGVGCGMIINGEIYHGISGTAGEVSIKDEHDVGDVWIGNISALKPWAAHLGIPDEAREMIQKGGVSKISDLVNGQTDKVTLETVFEAVKAGDKLATEIVQRAGERLGVRISFLINLLNPGAVVIGGGVESAGPVLIEAIKKMVRMCAFEEMANAVKIVPARLGGNSVSLGAASLVIRDVFAGV
ncbi:MAG: ROK family transcriptional regulator [Candidatus Omnitrophica bacterium]|nr:ROK family transcriptional regulator [Candidatus Omnitrophota bacterium]